MVVDLTYWKDGGIWTERCRRVEGSTRSDRVTCQVVPDDDPGGSERMSITEDQIHSIDQAGRGPISVETGQYQDYSCRDITRDPDSGNYVCTRYGDKPISFTSFRKLR